MRPTPPAHIAVKRSDPVYGAHSYLTKVPVTAIRPFIEAFTDPGQIVLDPFAGSGMTGVAAAMCGRRAQLRDINVLGWHIGTNYVNLVDTDLFRKAVTATIASAVSMVGDVYATQCAQCGGHSQLSRTTWSVICTCLSCGDPVNFYDALEQAGWSKSRMHCPHCGEQFSLRGSSRVNEVAVLDTISCECQSTLQDQPPSRALVAPRTDDLTWPDLPIGADRQMFRASALAKNNLTTTASFFSQRNLAALAALRAAIDEQHDPKVRAKLLFAFTAILARASKRYQWSHKRPLNAAHQHYYIAPVFYEWNVIDLFRRKAEAVARSDEYLQDEMRSTAFLTGADCEAVPDVTYMLGSADALDLADGSVDYVFTDPPFGSNIFYSDMSLFQEAWLGRTTDHGSEAVVDRSGDMETRRTADRYERLIAAALCECNRVLRPEGWLSIVFSNSSGAMWALLQRAVMAAGFSIDTDRIAVLDKGQRSVKGLASGFENIVTADLVLSMQKTSAPNESTIATAPAGFLNLALERAVVGKERDTPSHIYLGVIRQYLQASYDVSGIDMTHIAQRLADIGFEIDAARGTLRVIAESAEAA